MERHVVFVIGAFMGFALAAGAATDAGANPLGPAASGAVQCYEPNEQTKTCRSLAAYTPLDGGRYTNRATILLSPNGPVTFESSSQVQIKAGAVCGSVSADDITSGKLRVAGQLLPDEQAAPYLAQIAQAMTPILGKEICTRYEAGASGLVAKAVVKNSDQTVPDQRVKWIAPGAGYSVAP